MTVIVSLCGKKQSGKTTLANFLHGHELKKNGVIEKFFISPEGHLVVNAMYYDEDGKEFEEMGVLDLFQQNDFFYDYASARIWPFIKMYNFADSLKDIAINLFNVAPEQVFGTDEQKNSIVPHLLWENMPGVFTKKYCLDVLNRSHVENGELLEDSDIKYMFGDSVFVHDPGPMTAREFMQYLGTDICRRMYQNVWVDNCLKRIQNDRPPIAIIADCRFMNEVKAIQEAGGKVIRLTRKTSDSTHQSEIDTDNYQGFDAVIDNQSMSINESTEAFLDIMIKMGITQKLRNFDGFGRGTVNIR